MTSRFALPGRLNPPEEGARPDGDSIHWPASYSWASLPPPVLFRRTASMRTSMRPAHKSTTYLPISCCVWRADCAWFEFLNGLHDTANAVATGSIRARYQQIEP